MKFHNKLGCAAALLCLAASAAATPVTFDLAGSPTSSASITSFQGDWLCNFTGCGASVNLNPNLDSLNRTLSAGESWAFDFFTINFYGLGGGSGTIAASLGFDSPLGAPTAPGTGLGTFFTSWILTGGSLLWSSQPGDFVLADGTAYTVAFENLWGIEYGSNVTVSARLTLNSEPTVVAVPEPTTVALLGLGLLALGFATRIGRSKKN